MQPWFCRLTSLFFRMGQVGINTPSVGCFYSNCNCGSYVLSRSSGFELGIRHTMGIRFCKGINCVTVNDMTADGMECKLSTYMYCISIYVSFVQCRLRNVWHTDLLCHLHLRVESWLSRKFYICMWIQTLHSHPIISSPLHTQPSTRSSSVACIPYRILISILKMCTTTQHHFTGICFVYIPFSPTACCLFCPGMRHDDA